MKKNNKKGFTLIELLAVIAIIAILMLLVAPNILSMFTSGKKSAFITQYQRVWDAAETSYVASAVNAQTPSTVFCNFDGCDNPLDIKETDINYYVVLNNVTGKVEKAVITNSDYYIDSNVYKAKFGSESTDAKVGSKSLSWDDDNNTYELN